MFSCLRKSTSRKSLGGTNNAATTLTGTLTGITNAQNAKGISTLKAMLSTKFGVDPSAINITVLSADSAADCKLSVAIDSPTFNQTALNSVLYAYKTLLNMDLCASVNCGPNGTCSGGKCTCKNGYTGTKCDVPPPPPPDPCAGVNCGSHGTCSGGKCVCKDGYTGANCQTPPDPCAGVNCGSHGTCSGGKCVCKDGYTGANCQTPPDPCAKVNCGTHGACVGGQCYCKDGYSGASCQNAPDPCAGVNCGPNGTCSGGKCVCKNGYTGAQCQTAPQPPAWTRILHCDNGNYSTNRLDYTPAQIEQMAQTASQVKICSKGSTTDCEVSNPNTFPIQMLRIGDTISMNYGQPCDQNCVAQTWTGPRAANMWNSCTNGLTTNGQALNAGGQSGLNGVGNGGALVYHGCNNSNGLHISAADNNICAWSSNGPGWGPGDNIEVFINTKTVV